ncbi:lytic transglycosylase domain-containing protein [Alicyclobacillus kakegawensis]|uniref:lytic transglycosylase domain-containing protein n=1 Tax=Alicyclobacillus kakegawensis TaxID=392012 RepID=UPI00083291F0|nr:lytic transglycosylase domain-containing protein [Alicyclobacillus kakegawensis]
MNGVNSVQASTASQPLVSAGTGGNTEAFAALLAQSLSALPSLPPEEDSLDQASPTSGSSALSTAVQMLLLAMLESAQTSPLDEGIGQDGEVSPASPLNPDLAGPANDSTWATWLTALMGAAVPSNPDHNPADGASALTTGATGGTNTGSSTGDGTAGPNLGAGLNSIVDAAAARYHVPAPLIRAVIQQESGGNSDAVSHSGAAGLMQLMPATARALGVTDVFDPVQNVMGGTHYLAELLNRFDGNVRLALAAYNAGPGAVEAYQGVPPYAETQQYVSRVLDLAAHYQQSGTSEA